MGKRITDKERLDFLLSQGEFKGNPQFGWEKFKDKYYQVTERFERIHTPRQAVDAAIRATKKVGR